MIGASKPNTTQRQFKPGEYLFREGERAFSLFLIQSGSVAVRKTKSDGEIEIARIFSNEVLGEISLFDGQPRSASSVALTEVQAMEITFEVLEKIFADVPPYLKTIIAAVAERLRRADETIRMLQKEMVPTGKPQKTDEFSAADALAAADPTESD